MHYKLVQVGQGFIVDNTESYRLISLQLTVLVVMKVERGVVATFLNQWITNTQN